MVSVDNVLRFNRQRVQFYVIIFIHQFSGMAYIGGIKSIMYASPSPGWRRVPDRLILSDEGSRDYFTELSLPGRSLSLFQR